MTCLHPRLAVCWIPLALGACPAADDGDPSASSATEASSSTEASSTAEPDTGTEPSTGSSGSSSTQVPGTGTAPGTDTEAATDTDDPTGGMGLPAECEAADPMVSSGFILDIGNFPVDSQVEFDLEAVPCAVTDVQMSTMVVTTLTCEGPDAMMHTIGVEIDPTDAGDPVWQAGDAVVLDYHFLDDTELRTGEYYWFSLRRDSGELLLGAVLGDGILGGDFISAARSGFSPIEVEVHDEACGYRITDPDAFTNLAVTFAIGEDELQLFGEHHGVLESGDLRFAIDLGTAEIGHCCHYLRLFQLVLRAI